MFLQLHPKSIYDEYGMTEVTRKLSCSVILLDRASRENFSIFILFLQNT